MAFSGFSWQLGFIVGPGLGGALLAATGSSFWIAPALLCLAGGAAALRLERRIPPEYRRTPGV